jgi:hypothetical protein
MLPVFRRFKTTYDEASVGAVDVDQSTDKCRQCTKSVETRACLLRPFDSELPKLTSVA